MKAVGIRHYLPLGVGMFVLLLTLPALAQGADPSVPTGNMIIEIVTGAMSLATGKVVSQAVQWLSALMLLQFVITNYKLLPHAELDSVFAKFVGSLMWFGVCWYILESGPDVINKIGMQFFRDYAPDLPSPAGIMLSVSGLVPAIMVVAAAIGVASEVTAQAILYVLLAIVGVSTFFAIKLLMLQLELGITVMLAPFNFAFLGLGALRDQGLAPFKSLMSLAYRIVLYGIVFSGFGMVGNSMREVAQKYSGGDTLAMIAVTSPTTLIKTLAAGVVAYIVLAGLLWKSDSIAANLSSGSTNLGTADVAGAAMAGAAAGAAVASMAQIATTPGKSMTDWMKESGVSMSNASSSGSADAFSAASSKPDYTSPSLAGTDVPSARTTGSSEAPAANGGTGTDYAGTPNAGPTETTRDPARDAAREARRQEKRSASQPASIAGSSSAESQFGDRPKTLSQGLRDFHQQTAQEKATTHVSINLNHD